MAISIEAPLTGMSSWKIDSAILIQTNDYAGGGAVTEMAVVIYDAPAAGNLLWDSLLHPLETGRYADGEVWLWIADAIQDGASIAAGDTIHVEVRRRDSLAATEVSSRIAMTLASETISDARRAEAS